jgi:MFS family permease
MFGLALGVPFVFIAGASQSLTVVIAAFFGWGFFKGIYDANIFASMFEVTRPAIRGTVVGVMNMAGWLFGAGTAPVIIGFIAQRTSLGTAISSAAAVYVAGALLLLVAAMRQPDAVPS